MLNMQSEQFEVSSLHSVKRKEILIEGHDVSQILFLRKKFQLMDNDLILMNYEDFFYKVLCVSQSKCVKSVGSVIMD